MALETHSYNPSTGEEEVGSWLVWGQLDATVSSYSETEEERTNTAFSKCHLKTLTREEKENQQAALEVRCHAGY